MELITRRLVLRPWRDSDAAALYQLARDPRIGGPCGWPPHKNKAQSLHILRDILCGPERYAVTLRTDGTLIGAIDLKTQDECDFLASSNEYAVGYWIGAAFWGNGYAAEALAALMEHARVALHAEAILARHLLDNEQSHRVMEKCGLKLVRTYKTTAGYPLAGRECLIMRRDL